MSRHFIKVAIGIVIRDGQVLVALRPDHVPHGGTWEFPGGKFEHGETPLVALTREIKEEVGIEVITAIPLLSFTYEYRPDYRVALHTWQITAYRGEPVGCEGQVIDWVDVAKLQTLVFPAGNYAIVQGVSEILHD